MISKSVSSPENVVRIKQLYERMLAISIMQKAIVDQENEDSWSMDEMADLMLERQDIIQQIDELGPIDRAIAAQDAGQNDVGKRAEEQLNENEQIFNQAIEHIKHSILSIQTNDHISQTRLEEGMQKISAKLSQTRANTKAQNAYDKGDVYSSAWFIDKKQ